MALLLSQSLNKLWNEIKAPSSARWYKEKVKRSETLGSLCLEATVSPSKRWTSEPLCTLVTALWSSGIPTGNFFISGHLKAGEVGKQRGEGRRNVGVVWLAPSLLGKHASNLLTEITFQKWKGSVQLRLESKRGNDSQLSTHNRTTHPAEWGSLVPMV